MKNKNKPRSDSVKNNEPLIITALKDFLNWMECSK